MPVLSGTTTAFIPSTDLERARAFYGDRLGLRVVLDDALAFELDLGHGWLRIVRVQSFTPHPFTVFGWQVDDIRTTLGELAVEPLRYDQLEQDEDAVWRSPAGALIAWFADPDGNVLSLTQR
jgi:catechol 2,3-dioxygenase-like lactoylglutathione lyase family enzyme